MIGLRRAGRSEDDEGFTLVELLVSISLLVMLAGIFTGLYTSVLKGVTKQTAFVDAQAATSQAFSTMDKQIRYADAITTPSTDAAGNQWIEWEIPDPTIPMSQSPTQKRCYQWEATSATGLLRYRTWYVTASPVASGWTTRLTSLIVGTQPVFTLSAAGLEAAPFSLPSPAVGATVGVPEEQQVGVALSVAKANPTGRSSIATIFDALNSLASTDTSNICTQIARS